MKEGFPAPIKPDLNSLLIIFMSIKIVEFPTKNLFLFLTLTNDNLKFTSYGCGSGSKDALSKTKAYNTYRLTVP